MGEAYAHPEVLVSADWVQEHLNDPRVRIVESDELALEDKFLGSAYQRNDGTIFLVMPAGQDAGFRDHMTRGLIAAMFDVKVPGWPGTDATAFRTRGKRQADSEAGAA